MVPIAGILTAVDVIVGLAARIQSISSMIAKAKAENRDLTSAEMDSLVTADDVARKALQDAIDAARAAGK